MKMVARLVSGRSIHRVAILLKVKKKVHSDKGILQDNMGDYLLEN